MSSLAAIPPGFQPGISSPLYLTRRLLLDGFRRHADAIRGRVLDFGCGAKPYRAVFTCSEYIGVDYEGQGHSHKEEQIDFFYDGNSLPFDDAGFDAVFSSEVFEHVFNLPHMLLEINRVLKPGGKLLISCPFAICEHEQPNDFARYTSFAIRHLLEQARFKVLVQEKLGDAQTALWQMRITYWNLHVVEKLRHIPMVRTVARVGFNAVMNVLAKGSIALLPSRQDLYLNNLVLAEKQ
ncbi:MAG: class I SAM-dependent methyltransferase [Chitinophagaceae bacterium]|jgi:SAM-dependent methyltransferase|nr:class I SAM-dependent methyltransferase [Chitinophagaceae bacterium]